MASSRAPAGSAVAPASRTKTAPEPASRNCSGSRRPTARSSAVCSTRPAHGDIAGISSGLAICKPRPFWREITRRKPDRMKLSDGEADRRSPHQRSLGRLRLHERAWLRTTVAAGFTQYRAGELVADRVIHIIGTLGGVVGSAILVGTAGLATSVQVFFARVVYS